MFNHGPVIRVKLVGGGNALLNTFDCKYIEIKKFNAFSRPHHTTFTLKFVMSLLPFFCNTDEASLNSDETDF